MTRTWATEDAIEWAHDTMMEQFGNIANYNVVSGCAVTYDAANMTLDIAAGSITHNGSRVSVSAQANALTLVSKSAATIDARTMALQQFEALKALGASPTTRLVLPVDLLPMARHLGEYAEIALAASRGPATVRVHSGQDNDVALVQAESGEDVGTSGTEPAATDASDRDDAPKAQPEATTPHTETSAPETGAGAGTT